MCCGHSVECDLEASGRVWLVSDLIRCLFPRTVRATVPRVGTVEVPPDNPKTGGQD